MKNLSIISLKPSGNRNRGFIGYLALYPLMVLFCFFAGDWKVNAQNAEKVNNINGGMPNRISMNVTVAKQTQGATFGEKVNAGLHAAGSAISQGASLLGGALPGGSIISAALLKAGSEVKVWELKSLRNGFSLPDDLDPAVYELTIVVTTGTGSADTLVTPLSIGVLSGENGGSYAVSSVSHLTGTAGGGAAAAAYAATGKSAKPSGKGKATGNPEKSPQAAVIQNIYSIYLNGVEYALVRPKTRHEAAMNAIRNMK